MTMYFITTFCNTLEGEEQGIIEVDERVTWGFYADKNTAVLNLNNDPTNMHEGYAEYAFLSAISEGICNPEEQWLFQYDHDREGYFEIDTPKELKIGYSLIAFA